jgi:prevent-host-death family protein
MVMTTESLANVKAHLSEMVDRVAQHHDRIVVTRNGRPAAVLISPDDLATLEETLSVLTDPEALRDLAEADTAYARGEYTDAADMARIMRERAGREAGAA